MRISTKLAVGFACLININTVAGPSLAGSFAISAGKLVITTDTDRFLPAAATGDLCVTATAGGVVGGAANFAGNA